MVSRRKHNKIFDLAKKRDFRRLWIVRISEALKEEGYSYSRFIKATKDKSIELDRKILANLISDNREAFTSVVKVAFGSK